MNDDSSFERNSFELHEERRPAPAPRQLYLAQARAMLEAAMETAAAGHTWPVFVQDCDGITLLRGDLPSLLAVQRLREDLADLGYRQVAGAAEGIYVFRLRGQA
jgi:hypothetical protein